MYQSFPQEVRPVVRDVVTTPPFLCPTGNRELVYLSRDFSSPYLMRKKTPPCRSIREILEDRSPRQIKPTLNPNTKQSPLQAAHAQSPITGVRLVIRDESEKPHHHLCIPPRSGTLLAFATTFLPHI
ncbi:hypothetical protein AVEN_56281-1 [Araneus ventricosus]|uniref:Uncharacterized protein n=1 Tax=Araneus ventricosus TaxID=182803 RepID=A0A4Y1ZLW2_ARAVE|nr:hypothetical protein AVEN_3188-1 [Araneus ventricosus]GBL55124.1 hypothetical protein AVEN_56281-1 [Araneus ventricosus]